MVALFDAGPVETPEDQLLAELGTLAEGDDGDMVSALRFSRRAYARGKLAQAARVCEHIVRWFDENGVEADSDPNLALVCVNAQYHLAVARYDGAGVEEDTAGAVRAMSGIVNHPILAADFRLDLRLDRAIAELEEVLTGDEVLRGVLYCLGCAHMAGHGVVQDEATALAWFSRAASLGCSQSAAQIGAYYMSFDDPVLPASRIDVRDAARAREHLTRAAELGDVGAMSRLGLFLLRGEGRSELRDSVYDNVDAVKWLRAGAKAGDFEAEALLALAYFKMKLYSKARQFADLAAQQPEAVQAASPAHASVALWLAAKMTELEVGDGGAGGPAASELYARAKGHDGDAYLRMCEAFSDVSARVPSA